MSLQSWSFQITLIFIKTETIARTSTGVYVVVVVIVVVVVVVIVVVVVVVAAAAAAATKLRARHYIALYYTVRFLRYLGSSHSHQRELRMQLDNHT